MSGTMKIALISKVFSSEDGPARLRERLAEARDVGAELAVLPELPLNPWSPATHDVREDDAEPPDGPRSIMQSQAAHDVGIGLIGGAIVRDPEDERRRNRALIYNAAGVLVATYAKLHVPEEPGFWETSHYERGIDPPSVIDAFDVPFGIQICSDINRPAGSHILSALGAEAVIVPRATERATYERWKLVFRANALTSSAYVLSVNRPQPEQGVELGGPSIVVAPDGEVVLETTDTIGLAEISRDAVAQARQDYPGYLPLRATLYANAWNRAAEHLRPARPLTEQSGIF